jgi:hypothetical protein
VRLRGEPRFETIETGSRPRLPLIIAIALCSFSSLAYEILLTRIFSISLWYHFAFMIVSVAMLGLGASGTCLSLFPGLKSPSSLGPYTWLLGSALSASYLLANRIPFDPVALSWDKTQLFYIGLYYLILSVPFFLAGCVIATAFASFSARSGTIYGGDLLGAGLGALGVLWLLTRSGPDEAVFLISTVALSASFLVGGRGSRTAASVLIACNLAMLIFHPGFTHLRMSPYKGLQAALRYPGAKRLETVNGPFSRIDLFRSPAVRFAPGLSLGYLEPLPEQVGVAVDGGEVYAVTSPADRRSLGFLRYLPSALPFAMGRREHVLILDPKGGLQVLLAEEYGSSRIYKVESVPGVIETIKQDLGRFSGGIYDHETWSKLGRSWLSSREEKFDLIDISLMGTMPEGFFGVAEDYRYTVEAFKEYLNHLKPEGLLTTNLFILYPPRAELRLLDTLVAAMEEAGVKGADEHLAAIRSWDTLCLLVKKSPLTPGEKAVIRTFTKERMFDLVAYPGIKPEETNIHIKQPTNEYVEAFQRLLDPSTRREFTKGYLFDIRPVRDENPFFHYYLKLGNIRGIYKRMGEKWQFFVEEGYLLPAILLQVLVLSLLFVLLPVVARRGVPLDVPEGVRSPFGHPLRMASFFAFLGTGYLFVEIALVQKMILPLEHPSLAFSVVLASMLICSGTGSLLSNRVQVLRTPRIALLISLFVFIYSFLLPAISGCLLSLPVVQRMGAVFLFIGPLGVLMGTPFPAALRLIGERHGSFIPWAWAINGCSSVLAPLLALMIAMVLGFRMVLWMGGAAYLAAFFVIPRLRFNATSHGG